MDLKRSESEYVARFVSDVRRREMRANIEEQKKRRQVRRAGEPFVQPKEARANGVDLVFDVIGGDLGKRSAGLIRAGVTLVSIVRPAEVRPADGLAAACVVVPDRAQLSKIVQRCGTDGYGRTSATSRPSTMPSPPLNPAKRIKGKTVVRVRPWSTRPHRCVRPAGAVKIGRLRPISLAQGDLGNYPWPLALDLERAF